jgi:hypothetical protein
LKAGFLSWILVTGPFPYLNPYLPNPGIEASSFMTTQSAPLFPLEPAITLYDPLGELLGAGEGVFTYTFDDAVKLSGHACPTVAGAFLLVKVALDRLYPGG